MTRDSKPGLSGWKEKINEQVRGTLSKLKKSGDRSISKSGASDGSQFIPPPPGSDEGTGQIEFSPIGSEPPAEGPTPPPPAPGSSRFTRITRSIPLENMRDKLARVLPKEMARTMPKTLEPMAVAEWLGQSLQRQGLGFYGKLITIVLCAYFLADVSAILLGRFIPEPPPARSARSYRDSRRATGLNDYNIIASRNLFNSQGLIPGEDSPTGIQDMGGAPVRTQLPFNLIGTVVLQNPTASVATIEDKSANQVYPVRQDDEIPGKAKIVSIEPTRVVFVNLQSGRREYVELPEESATSPRVTVGSARRGGGGPGIEQVAPNQFNVSRGEVDKALTNLNQVLTQARAVPNFENGIPAGYKLFQIVPGSIYDKLGLQNGDTLVGLNGQMVDNPGKAFEMLNELKTANYLELSVKRGGKTMNFQYNIN